MTIKPFPFQQAVAAQIADRFSRYLQDRPIGGTTRNPKPIPFYQALAAITGAGKTVILADAVSQIRALLSPLPIVLWLSKGRVVVEQTFENLQDGGKYRHLLPEFDVQYLSEFDASEAGDSTDALLLLATVGTFNQKDKEEGERLIFKSEIDTADQSVWEALKGRWTVESIKRPLLIVYDEGHNLTEQQSDLLMELEPDAIIVAGATLRAAPPSLSKAIEELKSRGWADDDLVSSISSRDVAESGLIKGEIVLGGYDAAMEKTVDELLGDMRKTEDDARRLALSARPKAIYVCKTNVKETNQFQKDDHRRPFRQREAPPILIWRHLVERKGVDPALVAVYSNLTFDHKRFPPPDEFVLFKGGQKDYARFKEGSFQHVIFNLTLQEGWDDPECYFAYIDKNMGSKVQVEQIIGRVLRQPGAQHYESSRLNSAHFYVRVDKKGVFGEVVDKVRNSVSSKKWAVQLSSYFSGSRSTPRISKPRKKREVPHVYLDSGAVLHPMARLVAGFPDFRGDTVNTLSAGAKAQVRQKVGRGSSAEVKWVPYEHSSQVTARWIVQLEVSKQFPKALDVAGLDDPKFDALVEFGSRADMQIRKFATEVVDTYLREVRLGQQRHNPYEVEETKVDPTKNVRFKNSLHPAYSGLNPLETDFAKALDNTRFTWCRNPARTGYGIPLVTRGQSKNFYPDFLVWRAKNVFAIDTTGEHLLREKTARKLLSVVNKGGGQHLFVRLVSEGRWNEGVEPVSDEGYTLWTRRPDQDLGVHHFDRLMPCVKTCLKGD